MKRKKSFISNILGEDTYAYFKQIALLVSIIGTGIVIVLYVLSRFFHVGIISYLITLTNGYSLLFIGYILALIVLFDFEVEVEEPEDDYWHIENGKDIRPYSICVRECK